MMQRLHEFVKSFFAYHIGWTMHLASAVILTRSHSMYKSIKKDEPGKIHLFL